RVDFFSFDWIVALKAKCVNDLNVRDSLNGAALFFHKLLYGAVHRVGDPDIAIWTDCNRVGFSEFSYAFAGFSDRGRNLTIQIHPEDLARITVDHIHILRANPKTA